MKGEEISKLIGETQKLFSRQLSSNTAFILKRSKKRRPSRVSRVYKTLKRGAGEAIIQMREGLTGLDAKTKEQLELMDTMSDTIDGGDEIINLMKDNDTNHHVLAYGFERLSTIAVRESIGLVHLGVVELVLDSMKNFPKSKNLQEYGCQLIWNLAVEDKHKILLVDAGVVELLFAAIDNHSNNIKVLHKAIGAIKILSLKEIVKLQIDHEGKVEKIFKKFRRRGREENPKYADFLETTLEWMQNYSFGKTVRLSKTKR